MPKENRKKIEEKEGKNTDEERVKCERIRKNMKEEMSKKRNTNREMMKQNNIEGKIYKKLKNMNEDIQKRRETNHWRKDENLRELKGRWNIE